MIDSVIPGREYQLIEKQSEDRFNTMIFTLQRFMISTLKPEGLEFE